MSYVITDDCISFDAGVGEGSGVNDDKTDITFSSVMYMFDKLDFGVALHTFDAEAVIRCDF